MRVARGHGLVCVHGVGHAALSHGKMGGTASVTPPPGDGLLWAATKNRWLCGGRVRRRGLPSVLAAPCLAPRAQPCPRHGHEHKAALMRRVPVRGGAGGRGGLGGLGTSRAPRSSSLFPPHSSNAGALRDAFTPCTARPRLRSACSGCAAWAECRGRAARHILLGVLVSLACLVIPPPTPLRFLRRTHPPTHPIHQTQTSNHGSPSRALLPLPQEETLYQVALLPWCAG